MPSYGTIPSERGQRRGGGFTASHSMRLVAMVLLSSAALITLLALAQGPRSQSSRRWLLQTQLPMAAAPVFPPTGTQASGSSEPSAVEAATAPNEVEEAPTAKDVISFIAEARLHSLRFTRNLFLDRISCSFHKKILLLCITSMLNGAGSDRFTNL